MGKKKKTYVRPEMKIIEVKTEGVIAASNGEIIIDPIEAETIFTNSCVQGGAPLTDLIEGQCSTDIGKTYTVNINKNCNDVSNNFYIKHHFTKGESIKVCKREDGYYTITRISN